MLTMVDAPSAWGQVVSTSETGLLRTAVYQGPTDAFTWWMQPGGGSTASFTAPEDSFRSAVSAASGAGLNFVLPQPHGDGLAYRTASPISAAFWWGADRAVRVRLVPSLDALTRGLSRLHNLRVDAPMAQPPSIDRLNRWLDGVQRHGNGARLHEMASRRWGSSGVRLLRDWAQDVCGNPGSLLHGNVSLGGLLPPLTEPAVVELLTGPDLTSGHREFDIGWVLGELLELSFVDSGRNPLLVPDLADDELAMTVVRGCGDVDLSVVGRVMVLRLVTHMQDFASYMPWDDDLESYVELTRTLLDVAPGHLPAGPSHV